MFLRYDLRTTDVDGARRFYADALALDFTDDLGVWPLHEQARARGAPAHWLGQLGVADLDAMLKRFVDAGAERLGPTVQGQDGTSWTVLRDPFGAVVALRGSTQAPASSNVAWHHLHVTDRDRAWAFYSDAFGWKQTGTFDDHLEFSWRDGGAPIGSIANTARLPGVHTHWLYYFPVDDIDATEAKIVAAGGEVFLKADAKGMRIAACHDPQRAAFGIVSR